MSSRPIAENAPIFPVTWLRAFKPVRMQVDGRERLRVTVGAFVGILLTAVLCHTLGLGTQAAWIVAPMGASAVLVFGVPAECIDVRFGDTDRATGFGSAGSRSLFVVGSAVSVAATRTVAAARDLAASALESAAADIEYLDGVFRIAGTDRQIGLFELAARQAGARIARSRG